MMSRSENLTLTRPPVRIPQACEGLQVNCCRNPSCANYGQADPEGMEMLSRSERVKQAKNLRYVLRETRPRVLTSGGAIFACKSCKEGLPLKSNVAIVEEYQRLRGEQTNPGDCCKNADCPNHARSAHEHPDAYRKFGYQPAYQGKRGNPRRQCLACKQVITLSDPASDQRKQIEVEAQDVLLCKLLVGKMPLRRILATLNIDPRIFYVRLRHFSARFTALTRAHEARLAQVLSAQQSQRLVIGVDRQEYTLNWVNKYDKRNVRLLGVASAENRSGYVFGPHLNFDPTVDPRKIEAAAQACGDGVLAEPYRRHARLWLPIDYERTALRSLARKVPGKVGAGARAGIEQRYQETLARTDLEEGEAPDTSAPPKGMQVHSSYTMYAHFLYLREILGQVNEIGFALDQDSGMRAAFLGSWTEAVRSGQAHAFYVRYNKNLTVEEKKARARGRRIDLQALADQHPDQPHWRLLREQMKQAIAAGTPHGPWRDRWVHHPHTSMFEPEKELALLTPFPDSLSVDAIADRHLAASLHGVSRFFLQVRRMLSLFERPILSGNRRELRSIYSGYAPYNPAVAQQALDLFRGYYNYCKPGEDGVTPAMRLGLADRIYSIAEVIGAEEPSLSPVKTAAASCEMEI